MNIKDGRRKYSFQDILSKTSKLVFYLEKAEQILLIIAVFYRTKIKGKKTSKNKPQQLETPNYHFPCQKCP